MGERRQTKGDEHRSVAKPTYEEFAMYCSMAGFMKDNLKWLYGRFDDVGWLLPSRKVPKKWEDLVKKWNSLTKSKPDLPQAWFQVQDQGREDARLLRSVDRWFCGT